MRTPVPFAALLLALCVLAAPLAGCDLFGSKGDESEDVPASLVEGEYNVRYTVHMTNGDRFRGELFCVFFGEREIWDCEPGRNGQPVTAGGSFDLNTNKLILENTNAALTNFIAALSPDGAYDYEVSGDTLTLTQEADDSPTYFARDYHRIVLIRRDTSEYEYLPVTQAESRQMSLPSLPNQRYEP